MLCLAVEWLSVISFHDFFDQMVSSFLIWFDTYGMWHTIFKRAPPTSVRLSYSKMRPNDSISSISRYGTVFPTRDIFRFLECKFIWHIFRFTRTKRGHFLSTWLWDTSLLWWWSYWNSVHNDSDKTAKHHKKHQTSSQDTFAF